jgi:glycosyltransferase involved in cell wall biosynthesis
MRIAFLDVSPMDYTVDTPYERPTGGTQSAVCYLAVELAKAGHRVSIVNNTTQPGSYRGVDCLTLKMGGSGAFLNGFDVVIAVSGLLAQRLREDERVATRIVLWAHMADDQPAMQLLADPAMQAAWNGFAFVSDWQRRACERAFSLPAGKSAVLRNAVSPAVLEQPIEAPWFETGERPVLVYTTTPFRGLAHLIAGFPRIREAIPDVALRIFSSMKVYQQDGAQDPFGQVYAAARATPGVTYYPGVGQTALAAELAKAAALAYPSVFAETSCIVAMEAMAAGAEVIGTTLGALPETTAGYGHLVETNDDALTLILNFANLTIATLQAIRADPVEAAQRRQARIDFARAEFDWAKRAREWAAWLETLS